MTAVGDPNQSIYGWRGASAGGLEGFPTSFPQVHAGRHPHAGGRAPAVHVVAQRPPDPRGGQPRRRTAARVRAPGWRCRCSPPGPAPATVACTPTSPRPSRTRRARSRSSSATGGSPPGRVATGSPPRCSAASGRSSRPCAGRCGTRGCRSRSSASAGCCPRPRWSTSSPSCRPRTTRPAATPSCACSPAPARGSARRTCTRSRPGRASWPRGTVAARGRAAVARCSTCPTAPMRPPDVDVVVEADAVDERSIVDALDAITELPADGWTSRGGRTLSAVGRARLADLAMTLRALRAHSYLSVPELVGEAERLLGLDIEVAARARTSPGRARAQLDAFRDVAVEFARSADHPNLGGFLAWLEAADTRENGLDMPVSEPDPDAVQLITVHAAKGLEWDVVAVAGLVDGGLPATATQGKDGPKDSAWLTGLGSLPYPLRGDRHDLPVFAYSGAEDPKELEERRKQFVLDAGDHQVAEERRLAYVALTRARSDLLLTAAWWGDGTRVRKVSMFLDRARRGRARRDGGWDEAPDDGRHQPARVAGAHGDLAGGPLRRRGRADPPRARRGRGRPRPRGDGGAPTSGRPTAPSRPAAAPTARSLRAGPEPHPWDVLADRLLAERERVRTTVRRGRAPRAPVGVRAGQARERPGGVRRSTCADRSRPNRPRRRAAAPGSTPGSRAGTAAPPWSTSTRCRAPTTTRRPSTWTSRRSGTRSWRPSGRTGRPSRSRWTSRSRSTATCCAPASTRCSPTPLGAPRASSPPWSSSTGRPVHHRRTRRPGPPASSSWPSTGSRGRAGRAPRSTRCARRSATSVPARPCTRSGCSTRPRSPRCCARRRRRRVRRASAAVEPRANRRGSRTNAPTRRRPGWEGTNAAPSRRSDAARGAHALRHRLSGHGRRVPRSLDERSPSRSPDESAQSRSRPAPGRARRRTCRAAVR